MEWLRMFGLPADDQQPENRRRLFGTDLSNGQGGHPAGWAFWQSAYPIKESQHVHEFMTTQQLIIDIKDLWRFLNT